MTVLGLDTTGPDCSACLVRDDRVLAYDTERIGRGHAERLAPMVADILDEAGLSADAVERIAVCTGPGSFTGLRVALSFAKGFALPRQTPIIGLNALSVAYLMDQPDCQQIRTVYRDIKRGQVMFGDYQGVNPVHPDHPIVDTMEQMRASTAEMRFDSLEAEFIDVRVMARAALSLDPAEFPAEPLYARAPDAKLPGGVSP